MNRVFVWVTAVLTGIIGVLIGIIVRIRPAVEVAPKAELPQTSEPAELPSADREGVGAHGAVNSPTSPRASIRPSSISTPPPAAAACVVRFRWPADAPDLFDDPLIRASAPVKRRAGAAARVSSSMPRGILTNHHVIEGAERLTVKLATAAASR